MLAVFGIAFVAAFVVAAEEREDAIAGWGRRGEFWTLQRGTGNVRGDALVIWVNGGPGCSSLQGIMHGIGRWRVGEDGDVMDSEEMSLLAVGDILSIDAPKGTGGSFLRDGDKYDDNYEKVGIHLALFINEFLLQFPEYYGRSLLFSGESMAGHFIPFALSRLKIMNPGVFNKAKIFLVSPWVDPVIHYESYIDYLIEKKVIQKGSELHETAEKQLIECINGITQADFTAFDVQRCYNFTDYLLYNKYYMFDVSINRVKDPNTPLRSFDFRIFEQNIKNEVYANILGYTGSLKNFTLCSKRVADTLRVPTTKSVIDEYKSLVLLGTEIHILAGEDDLLCNYIGAQRWISKIGSSLIQLHIVHNAGHMIGIRRMDEVRRIAMQIMGVH